MDIQAASEPLSRRAYKQQFREEQGAKCANEQNRDFINDPESKIESINASSQGVKRCKLAGVIGLSRRELCGILKEPRRKWYQIGTLTLLEEIPARFFPVLHM